MGQLHMCRPRPKRKATHPYPQKASKIVFSHYKHPWVPSSINTIPPRYGVWDEASMLANSSSSKIMPPQDEFTSLRGVKAGFFSMSIPLLQVGVARISNSGVSGIGSSFRTIPNSDMPKEGKQASMLHGIPDFVEVYSFIGSVFDPDSEGHVQKLKEMDPINFETVLLLMRNLTVNLCSPDFEPIRKVLSSYDVNKNPVGVAKGVIPPNQMNDIQQHIENDGNDEWKEGFLPQTFNLTDFQRDQMEWLVTIEVTEGEFEDMCNKDLDSAI
ncbi:Protein REVEILLE 8 [Hibiscus syriacus]|uniref:Protein REVEILLE 8 n=1 Tax=Hibiscus syriacus TaxID=106335 RepID=A0A6A3BLT3_HIBSY|nr:Protein REVEILLE 8 [Hibiscus syriacus]